MLSPWVFLNYILPSHLAGSPFTSLAEGENREDCKLSDDSTRTKGMEKGILWNSIPERWLTRNQNYAFQIQVT